MNKRYKSRLNIFYVLIAATLMTACVNEIIYSENTIQAQLDSLYKKEFPSSTEPGGSFLIKKGDSIIFLKSYGVADIETQEKITENTIFNTGSVSKTFVANGLLILEEKGELSLEDNLAKYFDDFANKEISEKVKIKHMLTHTSGIPDARKVADNIEFYLTAKDKENFAPLKAVENLNFEPGEQFEYSNPVYNGLALIIEQISNQPWQEFVIENIFKPSGMNDSKITNGSYPDSGVSHGYIVDENGNYKEYDYGEVPTFAASGNSGIWSSVRDLERYETAMQKGIFISKNTNVKARSPIIFENWKNKSMPNSLGYSWFSDEYDLYGSRDEFPVDFLFHTGGQGGFRALFATIPEKDILFIALFNRPPSDYDKLVKDSLLIFEQYNWMDN